MGPRKISFSDAQRKYDNLTPEDMHPHRRKVSVEPDDDYEDPNYYNSKEFSKVMDAYERRIYGD
jgi:hypothetical protein